MKGDGARRPLAVGDVVTCAGPFASPIGCCFAAGDRFVVDLVGERAARARHDRTGSVVWIRGTHFGSSFLTG